MPRTLADLTNYLPKAGQSTRMEINMEGRATGRDLQTGKINYGTNSPVAYARAYMQSRNIPFDQDAFAWELSQQGLLPGIPPTRANSPLNQRHDASSALAKLYQTGQIDKVASQYLSNNGYDMNNLMGASTAFKMGPTPQQFPNDSPASSLMPTLASKSSNSSNPSNPNPMPKSSNYSSIANLPNLTPGMRGNDVKTLQNWLVQNGYMTQAQMNTGPGIYGPQTTAAIAAWQKSSGINAQGNPGYFGPISKAYIQNQGNLGTQGQGGGTPGTELPSTGNPALDAIQNDPQLRLQAAKISPGMQITPELTTQFLAWAHQAVAPQTQQLIQSEIGNINASSKNLATQYGNQEANIVQNFGTNLATEQNSAGNSGTAFSGLRNLGERNMVNAANRDLSSLDSQASYDIGQGLRMAAANVGSSNTGGINAPTLTSGALSLQGGSRGSFNQGNTLDFNYNPSMYTVGNIPTSQYGVERNLANDYLSQYSTLAASNSNTGRSMKDLIGGITGLPKGYQIPNNLQ